MRVWIPLYHCTNRLGNNQSSPNLSLKSKTHKSLKTCILLKNVILQNDLFWISSTLMARIWDSFRKWHMQTSKRLSHSLSQPRGKCIVNQVCTGLLLVSADKSVAVLMCGLLALCWLDSQSLPQLCGCLRFTSSKDHELFIRLRLWASCCPVIEGVRCMLEK